MAGPLRLVRKIHSLIGEFHSKFQAKKRYRMNIPIESVEAEREAVLVDGNNSFL